MPEEKFYFTKQGLSKIEKEYEGLLALQKAKLQEEAPPAFHSEELETEFVAFKEDKDLLEARIAELEYIVKNALVIKKPSKEEKGAVGLGSKVCLASSSGKDEYQIVGTFEADPNLGKISDESPIGKALLGKKQGDEIKIEPKNQIYKIIKVSY